MRSWAIIGGIAVLLNLQPISAQGQMRLEDAAPVLDGAVSTYVEEYRVDGLPDTTTYRLYLHLSAMVHNIYAVFGTEDAPAHFPPAMQQDALGAHIGGINPAFWALMPTLEYDSWLSVGVDDGSASAGLAFVGISFDGALDPICTQSHHRHLPCHSAP